MKSFKYKGLKIRTQIVNDDIFLSASDVGKALEITSVQRVVRKIGFGIQNIPTPTKGGIQDVMYISVPNLYRLVFKSKTQKAIDFQTWVFDELLPTTTKVNKKVVEILE